MCKVITVSAGSLREEQIAAAESLCAATTANFHRDHIKIDLPINQIRINEPFDKSETWNTIKYGEIRRG